MATEYEVEQWKDLCEKVIMHNNELYGERNDALTQYAEAEYKRKIAEVKADGLERQMQELKAENEKLRELCLNAHGWMSRALYDGSARKYEYESITECMRELGIEVSL